MGPLLAQYSLLVVGCFIFSMDLSIEGVQLKFGIRLAKIDLLVFQNVIHAHTLDFWQPSITHRNAKKSSFTNPMPMFNGTSANPRSIGTKT